MSKTPNLDDRRAARLAQLEARAAEDAQQAADDATLDLPLLGDFLDTVTGPLAEAEARLAEIHNQLIRKGSSQINQSLTLQIQTLGQLRANLTVIAGAMKSEAEGMIAAPAAESKG